MVGQWLNYGAIVVVSLIIIAAGIGIGIGIGIGYSIYRKQFLKKTPNTVEGGP